MEQNPAIDPTRVRPPGFTKTSGRPRRSGPLALAGTIALALATLGCTGGGGSPRAAATAGPTTFADVDTAIESHVGTDHLPGAALLVVRDGKELRRRGYGGYDPSTVMPIASASKWLTAATLMTLVDEGRVALDAPVSTYLPEFRGPVGTPTIRQLLSHTSGIGQDSCIWEKSSSLRDCADKVATNGLDHRPGDRFSYGNTSFSVVGRVIEVVTGTSFEKAFEARIGGPVGMPSTRFDGSSYPTAANPVPAASGESSLDDYGRFVRMIAARGEIDGTRVLSESSVLEIERDQVVGSDNRGDAAVQTTGIPTYGLGVWRDVVSSTDDGVVVSGNGAYGFYPWIDRARNAYGVLAVYDARHGSEHAVPAAQALVHQVWAALDTETGAPNGAPTTVYGR